LDQRDHAALKAYQEDSVPKVTSAPLANVDPSDPKENLDVIPMCQDPLAQKAPWVREV